MKRTIHFKFLTGDLNWDQYGGRWISRKFNNGEFDYWYVMELINMEDATGDMPDGKYSVILSVVSPSEAGPDNLAKAIESCGWDGMPDNDITKVEVLHSYGISALVWQDQGNNFTKLMRQARQEATLDAGLLFGFHMDRSQNKIGSTGWDLIRGNLLAGIGIVDNPRPEDQD